MTINLLFLAVALGLTLSFDVSVRLRSLASRKPVGTALHLLIVTTLFGFWLGISGSQIVAAVLSVAFVALLSSASSAKHAMLGEPLLFSDLALLAAIMRHPRFYFTALSLRERVLLGAAVPMVLVAIAMLSRRDPEAHLIGLVIVLAGAIGLRFLLGAGRLGVVNEQPSVERDLPRFGLLGTLLIYWWRWRATPDPEPCALPLAATRQGYEPPEIILIVQCESFADPRDLIDDDSQVLPGLDRARAAAWQWGDLAVSGFGAYTMRTEYGVLFGRSEAELGYRRYDPFLTAFGETSYALSARVAPFGYYSIFVHPHDMRFYGRDRLMPAIGFSRIVGEESFPPPAPDGGRYVDDQTLGSAIGDLIDGASTPTLIYAVTMENHGPWDKDRLTGSVGGLDAYLRHLRSSDAMLSALTERLSNTGKTALLVFFGDHRPSIPGVTDPGGERHTPYVMLRFGSGGQIPANAHGRRADLSPDELHHAILRCVQGDEDGGVRGESSARRREAEQQSVPQESRQQ